MIKIYFAGSITGGRDDQEIYFKLIDYLKTKGNVLTEHIANPELKDSGEIGKLSAKEIFDRDVSWIKEANVILAEVTQVSLGVGYELGLSESLDKKIICLYRPKEGKKLSAMISGNEKFLVKEYQTIDNAKAIIDDFFKDL